MISKSEFKKDLTRVAKEIKNGAFIGYSDNNAVIDAYEWYKTQLAFHEEDMTFSELDKVETNLNVLKDYVFKLCPEYKELCKKKEKESRDLETKLRNEGKIFSISL